MRFPASFVLTLLLLLFAVTAGAGGPATPEKLADAYLQAVLQDDWQAAAALWSPAGVEMSNRLGISYRDLPLKLDSASMIVLERTAIQLREIAISVAEIIDLGSSTRIRFLLQAGDQTATADYTAVPTDGAWRFVDPAAALASGWNHRSTEFLDLYVQPSRQISEEAIRVLDQFIGETCERFGVPADRVEHLRAQKLRYYFCDDATVTEIVGAPTRGAALLQTDAVVTSEPCHLHELAHLLINYALQDLPLYTLPVLQEGTAVALGGRWGRSPDVMQGLGKYLLQNEMLSVDELLPWTEFRNQSADWTYAPSGILAGFLLDSLGSERFLQLYGDLSGRLPDLISLDRTTIQDRICAAAEMDWTHLQGQLTSSLESLSCGGVLPIEFCRGSVVSEVRASGVAITVSREGPWLYWEAKTVALPLDCVVFVREPEGPTIASRLFAERFPNRVFEEESTAVIITPEEIGIYDFRTDLLVAKYVASFCPEQSVVTEDGGRLRFRVRAELLPSGPWTLELVGGGV
jgi:hypothetical protein